MKLRSILIEAGRNISTGTTRAGLFFFVVALLSSGLVSLDLGETRLLLADAQHYQQVGASTLILAAPGRVDGKACEALGRLAGVQGAGAMRPSSAPLVLAAMPGAPVPRFEVSSSFLNALRDSSSVHGVGVYISAEVARTTGRSGGEALPIDGGALAVLDTFEYPADGRRAGMGWSVLVPSASADPFDECWVRQWPESQKLRSLLLQVIAPAGVTASKEQPLIFQLNTTQGVVFSGTERFGQRVLKYVPFVVLAVTAAAGAVSVRLRRLEFASNLHAGAQRRDLYLQVVLETAAWALPAALLVLVSTVLMVTSIDAADRTALLAQGSKSALALTVGSVAGAWIIAAMIQVKHFFKLFKDRN